MQDVNEKTNGQSDCHERRLSMMIDQFHESYLATADDVSLEIEARIITSICFRG